MNSKTKGASFAALFSVASVWFGSHAGGGFADNTILRTIRLLTIGHIKNKKFAEANPDWDEK